MNTHGTNRQTAQAAGQTAWNHEDCAQQPGPELWAAYVASSLWTRLLQMMQQRVGALQTLQYSGCSMQRGWNVKFRKGGANLFTAYLQAGWFRVLVAIGARESPEAKLLLPTLSQETRRVWAEPAPWNGAAQAVGLRARSPLAFVPGSLYHQEQEGL